MFETIQKVSKDIGDKLLIEFTKELISQGHKGTGALIDSLEYKVVIDGDNIILEIYCEQYGLAIDKGRRKQTRRVPVDALIEWLKVKGIGSTDKDIRSIAFAIQETIFKEGSPTKNAARAGKRTGWLTDTLNKEEQNIIFLLEQALGKDLNISIENEAKKQNEFIRENTINITFK